ncbi:hypothetical protein SMKI_14G1780 [Saccharomyces mikatae IFO 1815]|uniref:Uncharacterized protein n=1 Tax=Saccharomyces mikatae IFO 1815 TaxID=226126 RepID=A0AA35IS83_SACMI|nr:uncharacterized protein SMKI_14G1780 [Saccharomyces mikatae IFO 1815]CAI4035967.1 hypothetical protein SMKI_14G1780 [Saccharomyces mikatae IFO 1815]
MSYNKPTSSTRVEFKKIINLTLLFIIITLLFQNSVGFKRMFQKLLSLFCKKSNPNSASSNHESLPIFSESLIDFDNVNMADKTRLFLFLVFSFIITIPFMV